MGVTDFDDGRMDDWHLKDEAVSSIDGGDGLRFVVAKDGKNRWVNRQVSHFRMRFERYILLPSIALCLGCGGAQKTPPCEEQLREMLARSNEELCEPSRVSLYEMRITEWSETCPELAGSVDGQQLEEKLWSVQRCSDERRQKALLIKDCDERLKIAEEGRTCMGGQCVKYWRYLKRVNAQCDVTELEGRYRKRIRELKRLFEERTTEVNRLTVLGQLISVCDKLADVTSEKRARNVVNRVIAEVENTPLIMEIPKSGSETERFRNGAIESCEYALLQSYERILPAISKKLDTLNGNNTSKRWKRYSRKLTQLQHNLERVNGASLFPNASLLVQNTVNRYQPEEEPLVVEIAPPQEAGSWPAPEVAQAEDDIVETDPWDEDRGDEDHGDDDDGKNEQDVIEIVSLKELARELRQESESASTLTKTAATGPLDKGRRAREHAQGRSPVMAIDADPYGELEPSAHRSAKRDRNLLRIHRRKCQSLTAKARQCTRKISEYTRRGNQTKVSAYQTKLDRTQEKIEALKREIRRIYESTEIPSDILTELKKGLDRAGCSP